MTISYPLSLPTTQTVANISIEPECATGVAMSRFTFKQQIYQYDGQRWVLSASYPPLTKAQAGPIKAFLLSLNGNVGTFFAGDILCASPSGSVSGTILVNGGSQTGQILNADGFTPSAANVFIAGDQIQIGNYLYMIMANATANGSGQCALDIWPRLRSSPADNAAITYSSPKGLFRLDGPAVGWSANPEGFYDISFSAVEAI